MNFVPLFDCGNAQLRHFRKVSISPLWQLRKAVHTFELHILYQLSIQCSTTYFIFWSVVVVKFGIASLSLLKLQRTISLFPCESLHQISVHQSCWGVWKARGAILPAVVTAASFAALYFSSSPLCTAKTLNVILEILPLLYLLSAPPLVWQIRPDDEHRSRRWWFVECKHTIQQTLMQPNCKTGESSVSSTVYHFQGSKCIEIYF